MKRKRKWYDSPLYNWTGTVVSLGMLLLYIQRWLGPDPRASTPWVLAIWAVMFVSFLWTAVYTTWLRR